jgi:hypothetical protein
MLMLTRTLICMLGHAQRARTHAHLPQAAVEHEEVRHGFGALAAPDFAPAQLEHLQLGVKLEGAWRGCGCVCARVCVRARAAVLSLVSAAAAQGFRRMGARAC